MHATCSCHQAYSWLRECKASVFSRDNQIAGQRDLKASTRCDSIDRGDNRLVALQANHPTKVYRLIRRCLSGHLLSSSCCRCGGLEVVARRKCPLACTSQDGNPGIVVFFEVRKNL